MVRVFDARLLAVVVIEMNKGYETADPCIIWKHIATTYNKDLAFRVIRAAQREVKAQLAAVPNN